MIDFPKQRDGEALRGERWDGASLRDHGFEECTLSGCSMVGADLSGARIERTELESCNLSNAKLLDASLQDVTLRSSKVVGVDFGACRKLLLSVRFADCDLSYATFRDLDLRESAFERCRMHDVELVGCDLSGVSFVGAQLQGARLSGCDLRGADFREASGFSFELSQNKTKGAKFSTPEVLAFLAPFELDLDGP